MPSENAVRLSSAQKRDLLGMSAAAVITTALIAAPILLPHDAGVPALVDLVAEPRQHRQGALGDRHRDAEVLQLQPMADDVGSCRPF